MIWNKVEVIAECGTQVGVLLDENGVLVLVVKHRDEDIWPHGCEPNLRSVLEIKEGNTRFTTWYEGN